MNIAAGILVMLLVGYALYTIIKQSKRISMNRRRPDHYSTGTESGGLYYTAGDSFDKENSDNDSSDHGADSSWGSDSTDSSGGDSGGGGDGGGGGGD